MESLTAALSDASTLARIQFAFTVSFHILFPAFTIGLASYLAVLKLMWLITDRRVYDQAFTFWLPIFAVAFGMGVVSGIVMTYQFGSNWSVFSDKTGAILGPLLGYEVLSAFFLEAGFLGVMLFGRRRVGEGLHTLAVVLVAIGTAASGFWILSANSWMHTPAGYAINEAGQFVPTSWVEIIFNPSFPYRFAHMMLAAYLTTAFTVAAVACWRLLRDRAEKASRLMLSMAMWMVLVVAPLQAVVGDMHGLNTQEHQPMKIAAIEGHFETQSGAPLYLFGWPNMETGEVEHAIAIPNLGSVILKHDPKAEVTGLDQFPQADWPNVPIVFWAFRIMVGLGFAMIGLALIGAVLRATGGLYDARGFHRLLVLAGPIGFVSILCGWITTEVGRQPYVVYGELRTLDAISPVSADQVAVSLLAFLIAYLIVFGAGVRYMLRLAGRPITTLEEITPAQAGRAGGMGAGVSH